MTKTIISIVIPAFNEEKRLPGTLERVKEYLDARGDDYEIVVADDGSVDGTSRVAREAAARAVVLPQNRAGQPPRRIGSGIDADAVG